MNDKYCTCRIWEVNELLETQNFLFPSQRDYMQNHVRSCILHALHNTEGPKVCHQGSVRENPCGFCDQDSCFTHLKFKSMEAFQLPISLFWDAVQKCSRIFQGFHAQICQYIVLYALLLSLVILLPYGNTMPLGYLMGMGLPIVIL